MKIRTVFPLLLVITLLGCALPFPSMPVTGQPLAALNANVGCVFGYTQSEMDFASQWKEINIVTPLNFGNKQDDGIIQVSFPADFNFPFFENSYNSVSVSTNGFIAFNPYSNAYKKNNAIPMEIPPSNMVAAFWADLTAGGSYNDGDVYFQMQGTTPNRVAIFEWYQVTRLVSEPTETLTFEIVLHENGDIDLNYAVLNGNLTQVTVGIEDKDGVDGLQMAYNSAFLSSNKSYRLDYPDPGARVKAKPLYQGGFLAKGSVDLPLTIVNTGTGSDSFHFEKTIAGSPDGLVNIVDSLGAVVTSTPVLDPKGTFSARIRVSYASASVIGLKWSGTITVISNANAAHRFEVSYDAAIPAPFASFFVDATTAKTGYFAKDRQTLTSVLPSFSGTSFSIDRLPGSKYLLTWMDSGAIKKAVTAYGGGQVTPSSLPNSTDDESPQVAVTPNGTIGMAFVRWTGSVSNIFFARLDNSGNQLSLVQLTNSGADYSMPSITATPSNTFVITCKALTPLGGSNTANDIDVAVVNSAGTILHGMHHLTASQATTLTHYAPVSTIMQNGNVLVAFLSYLPGQANNNQVSYMIYRPVDNTAAPIQTVPGASGEWPRLTTLSNGAMLLAWVKSTGPGIGYAMFNSLGVINGGSPLELAAVNGWKVGQISMIGTSDAKAAVTWKDEWGMYLFYSLIDANGTPVTSPMAFIHEANPDQAVLYNSSTGKGIASFSTNFVNLPLVRK